MGKDFHFPFHFAEFLASTDLWSNEQVGAHIRILCHQADKGHLSDDAIGNRIGVSVWISIRERYRQDQAGLWYHPKLDAILKERADFVEKKLLNFGHGTDRIAYRTAHSDIRAKDSSKSKDKGKSSEGLIDKDIKALEDFDLEVKTQALENLGIERIDGKDE